MTYQEAINFLFNSLPVFEDKGAEAYKPGLERVREFAKAVGNPQDKFRAVHVAGTNGKGSTSHMLASIMQTAGYRTGLYTSPHLVDFRERIRVDGEPIPEQAVVEFTERHRDEMVRLGFSFFEMATVMALDWFARQGVDIAIIETGLGGRLDATNIITPVVSVITNIGLEHTRYLGGTIPLIAAEKAGIIKPGVPVVIGETDPESAPVFRVRAAEYGSTVVFADAVRNYELRIRNYKLDLEGHYQTKNLRTVLTTVDVLRRSFEISEEAVREGLSHAAARTGLAGRWQTMGRHPLVVCDTAHNAHGLAEVVKQVEARKYDKLYMVLGFVADKDLDSIIPLLPRNARYILTQASVGRAMAVGELQKKFAIYGIESEAATPVVEAVHGALSLASKGDMVYIGGSNFTVAEALPLFGAKP